MRDPTKRNCRGKDRSRHIFHFLKRKKNKTKSFVSFILSYLFLLEATAINNSGMKVVGEKVNIIIIETGLCARIVARKALLYESVQQFRSHNGIETLCDHLLSDRERQMICHFW